MSGSPLYSPSTAGVAKIAQDQEAGFGALMKYLTGSDSFGGGPFDDFLRSYLGPIATAVVNAQGNIAGVGNNGQPLLPPNIDQTFANIKSGLEGGQVGGKNIYQYLSDLGRQAIAQALGGPQGSSIAESGGLMQTLAPLLTMGMTGGNRSAYYRTQDDLLRGQQNAALTSPTLGSGPGPQGKDGPTWGQFITQSPFYNQYYGPPLKPTAQAPQQPLVPGAPPPQNSRTF